jgi:hypothetical protein
MRLRTYAVIAVLETPKKIVPIPEGRSALLACNWTKSAPMKNIWLLCLLKFRMIDNEE